MTSPETSAPPAPTEEEIEAAADEGIVPADFDPHALTLIAKYRAFRDARDEAQRELDEIKAELSAHITAQGARQLTVGGLPAAALSTFQKHSLDGKALQAALPEVYSKYLKPRTETRLNVSKA